MGGGAGERKVAEKGRKEWGEESRDQSLVWDYVFSDNILHLTHFFLSEQVFHGSWSDSLTHLHTHTSTQTHTHTQKHLHSCLAPPIHIMPSAKFTPIALLPRSPNAISAYLKEDQTTFIIEFIIVTSIFMLLKSPLE